LHNKPLGCGAPVASAAVPFTKKAGKKNRGMTEKKKNDNLLRKSKIMATVFDIYLMHGAP
jgi:hypothetical protein